MIYTVKRIDEDLDFGCEERAKDAPVMANNRIRIIFIETNLVSFIDIVFIKQGILCFHPQFFSGFCYQPYIDGKCGNDDVNIC